MKRLLVGRALYVGLLIVTISSSMALAQGISYRGIGPRVGLSANPDQVFVGVHFHLGELAKHLRFQPNIELGFGDDVFLLAGNAGALWNFSADWGGWKPYLGGELGLVYQDFDNGGRDDSDTDLSVNAVGGIEMRMKTNTRFLFELKIGVVEDPDVKLLIGWTF